MSIFLITPTGCRPAQFNLCQSFMKRQTYKGEVTWIIVDDCWPTTTDIVDKNFRENWTIKKIYPKPIWEPGKNSQGRNIAAAINEIKRQKDVKAIFIIEDDDCYGPTYLEEMMLRLKGFHAIGETNSIYYNVLSRTYFQHPNTAHASLFETAFTVDVIPVLEKFYQTQYIDVHFWSNVKNKSLFRINNLAIGIKGMPGRAGIGGGHTTLSRKPQDESMNHLKSLIGEDYKLYERYYSHLCV
jgi:hypothetical protein